MAYGVDVICCRGLSVVKAPPPVGLTPICRNRGDPLKQVEHAPKFNEAVNTPALTLTVASTVDPNWVPAPSRGESNSLNYKS
jgi:hypothetical protein